jgi:hypothetical protein
MEDRSYINSIISLIAHKSQESQESRSKYPINHKNPGISVEISSIPVIFAKILFKHGNFQKIDWLILVTVLSFFSRSLCCMVYHPTNYYTYASIYLYLFRQGYEYHVISIESELKKNAPIRRHFFIACILNYGAGFSMIMVCFNLMATFFSVRTAGIQIAIFSNFSSSLSFSSSLPPLKTFA